MSHSTPQEEAVGPRHRGHNRATIRYRCAPATIGRFCAGDDHELQHAWIMNISLGGIGLMLARPVSSGVAIVLHIRTSDTAALHELSAHVVHCTSQQPGEWLIGCEFCRPLSPDVLDSLL